ncbi:FliI/YscN family ATPase [uncultured Lentibacter sp.]|uniref:FliI/YscN family ATPase n=1 Tax=uncultured Lentibacter sp. TaxID=1659309 RepID=UPI002628F80E|nr:FliI/YscN family ATPase [uncultured Lentibacter sp.]
MADTSLKQVVNAICELELARWVGRVSGVENGLIEVKGLQAYAGHGDQVEITTRDGTLIVGEVLKLLEDKMIVLPESAPEGIALADRVVLAKAATIAPSEAWIGRVIDPMGRPLDGRALAKGDRDQPIKASPIAPAERTLLGARLETGMTAFNTVLPIVKGQRIGLFAGSGVGKSSLLGHFAKEVEADVVVLALIGERGRELAEFVQNILGPKGLARTVIITATSDQSALLRRRCAWTAMAVAEYFRDQGKHVLLLADSLTRFAEAHREVAVATGELPTMRGYPPSLSHQLMSLCERAGPGRTPEGAITAIFSVLVAGSDMDEPVADILRGVLDGHTVLDRAIAERGRYPAINLLRSISRSLPRAADAPENDLIEQVRYMLSLYEKSEVMIDAGLYEPGRNLKLDEAIAVWPELDAFLAKTETHGLHQSFDKLRLILRKAKGATRAPEAAPQRPTRPLPTPA